MSSFASEQPNNMVYYGIHSLLKPQEVTASEQRENFCTFDTLRAFLSRCFSQSEFYRTVPNNNQL